MSCMPVLFEQTFAELIRMADPKMIEQKVNEYNTLVGEQWHKLMGYEMQLVDQLEVSQCIR